MKPHIPGNLRVLQAMPDWCINTILDGKEPCQVRARAVGNGIERYDVLLPDRTIEANVSPDRLSPRPPPPTDFLLH